MKCLVVVLLLVGFHVGNSFAQQPLLTEIPESSVCSERLDTVISGEQAEVFMLFWQARNGATPTGTSFSELAWDETRGSFSSPTALPEHL